VKLGKLPPLFICGAGISIAPPASLPGTASIVNAALRFLLPSTSRRELHYRDLVGRIQPEVLFEQASVLTGTRIQNIWNMLRTSYAHPNIYHYLLVLLASRYKLPIITLNFDTLLEKASENLGLGTPEIYIPAGSDCGRFLTSAEVPAGRCRIWKIHGSIGLHDHSEMPSLQATMSQIARPNESLLKALKPILAKCKLYIVGYSGRDGDFFPELARLIGHAQSPSRFPTWIDPLSFARPNQIAYRRLNPSIWDRADMLQASPPNSLAVPNAADLLAVVENEFPWALNELREKIADTDFLIRLAKLSLHLASKNIGLDPYLSNSLALDDPVQAAMHALAASNALSQDILEAREEMCTLIKCELQRIKHCKAVEQDTFSEISLDPLEKEALLVCMLFHSGYMREAYEYGKSRMDRFVSELPARTASIVSLYFARLCDWNSQYDSFLHFTSVAGKLAQQMTSLRERSTKLMIEAGVECLSTRAISMRLGPVMNWPDQHFRYHLSIKTKLYLYKTCAAASFQLRKILAQFRDNKIQRFWRVLFPKPPSATRRETIQEEVAWQYYLDHRQVFLNYLIRPLGKVVNLKPRNRVTAVLAAPIKWIAKFSARIALYKLTRLVRRAGAATIQADIYLFRARYGIADDLVLAEHFWSLVSNPVGGALVLRDRGERALRARSFESAGTEFYRCYALSAACGSHLTALKALIGRFHVGQSFRQALWQKHVDRIQGEQHIIFFNVLAKYVKDSNDSRSLQRTALK
jgi:hypothetical protein